MNRTTSLNHSETEVLVLITENAETIEENECRTEELCKEIILKRIT